MIATMLPPDNHIHTEWSWDAAHGSMEASCARAVELGLGTIAFTEHMDLTRWVIAPEHKASMKRNAFRVGPDNRFNPPPLDTDGYQACIQECRRRYRDCASCLASSSASRIGSATKAPPCSLAGHMSGSSARCTP